MVPFVDVNCLPRRPLLALSGGRADCAAKCPLMTHSGHVEKRNRCRYWGKLIVPGAAANAGIQRRKGRTQLPIRPRFDEATLCDNSEFPSWRRNDQVNVIDGTSTLSRGFLPVGLPSRRPLRGGGNQGGFYDSAFTP
jgi:hypothetical protein